MSEKLLADVTHPARITLELRHDPDGRYRWYEMATDADTEVSAATPEAAWNDAAHVWGSPVWDFRRVAPTVASILADVPQYTLTAGEHAQWYDGDQRKHDALHEHLRRTLPAGTEVYDTDGVVVDVLQGGCDHA